MAAVKAGVSCSEVRTACRQEGLRGTALTLLTCAVLMPNAGEDGELDMLLREIGDFANKAEARLGRWCARGGLG